MELPMQNRKGDAMILVMCVMCVFITLSLSLLLSSAVLTANAQRTFDREQCRISAQTFSKIIEGELTAAYADQITFAENEGIRKFIRENIEDGTWVKHTDEPDNLLSAKISFVAETTAEADAGLISLEMYWESDAESSEDAAEETAEEEKVTLFVIVICEYRDETFRITTEYGRNTETHEMEEGKDPVVTWNWYRAWRS